MDDLQLLQDYLNGRSHDAFAAIVERYANLVYASALRHVRDRHLAEDISQAVFVVLTRKAATIPAGRSLGAWLLTTTRFVAMNQRRLRSRIEAGERRMADMTPPNMTSVEPLTKTTGIDWMSVGPILDEGLARLSSKDREAIALRFLESQPMAQVGQRLGVSQEAAQKRVQRALERLRKFLHRRGVAATDLAPALATLTTTEATVSGPLQTKILTEVFGPLDASANLLAKGAIALMAAQKLKIAALIALAACLMIGGSIAGVSALRRGSMPRTVTIDARPATPNGATAGKLGTAALPATLFDDGTIVSLAGARDFYAGSAWWGADGSLVPPQNDPIPHSVSFNGPDRRVLEVRFDVQGVQLRQKEMRVRFTNQMSQAANSIWQGSNAQFSAVVALPAGQQQTIAEFGLATGPWKPAVQVAVAGSSTTRSAATSAPTTLPTVDIGTITGIGGKTYVELIDRRTMNQRIDEAWRLVVITKDGKACTFSTVKYESGRTIFFVYNVNVKDVARAEFQVRPVEWKAIATIPLQGP
jgi:RNA polymerase sigma factor (sigma-70 family)